MVFNVLGIMHRKSATHQQIQHTDEDTRDTNHNIFIRVPTVVLRLKRACARTHTHTHTLNLPKYKTIFS